MRNSMKKILFSILLIIAFVGCATLSTRSTQSLKPYKTSKLKNGLNILYVNDDKLPYLSLSLVILSGYATDPKGQSGLTSATIELLNKGTQDKSAEQIAGEIEQMGAEYDSDVNADYTMVSLDGLSWQEDKLLNIFSDLILKPKFDEKEIARYKSRTISVISQKLDQLSYLAGEAFDKYFYKNHPYSQREAGSFADIKKLNKKSILDHYHSTVIPNKSWLIVVGKYSPNIEEKFSKYFGEWKSHGIENPAFPAVEQIVDRNILLVNNDEAAQAEIRIGHKGPDRAAPEHVANTIANSILGQGFTSRLVDRIRDQLGLTYSISSRTDFKLHGSAFEIATFTQNPKVGQTVSEIYKVYEKFCKDGITENELSIAKKYMIGAFPSLVETAEKAAYNLMILRIFGISDDYLLNYQKNIAKTTLAEVNAAIHKNYDPYNLKIVIVAQKSKVLDQLKGLGKVEVVEGKTFLK
jgi:zinc protease